MSKLTQKNQASKGNRALARIQAQRQRVELAAQWRALQKLGAMPDKVTAKATAVTPQRAAAIRKAYAAMQDHGIYIDGHVIRPVERVTTRAGRPVYRLGERFQAVPGKPRAPAGSIRTRTATIIAKPPGTRLETRKGRIVAVQPIGEEKSIVRENMPLIGAEDFLRLANEIDQGTFKLRRGENVRLYNNGSRSRMNLFGSSDLHALADLLRAYASGEVNDFSDWANASEIVLYRVRDIKPKPSPERQPRAKRKAPAKRKARR